MFLIMFCNGKQWSINLLSAVSELIAFYCCVSTRVLHSLFLSLGKKKRDLAMFLLVFLIVNEQIFALK